MSAEVVQEWLAGAQADLNAAWNCAHGPKDALTAAPYHVQQAAEKLIKAFLIAQGIDPPYTHELGALVRLVPIAEWRGRLGSLTRFAVYATAFRYPGEEPAEPIPSVQEIVAWRDRGAEG